MAVMSIGDGVRAGDWSFDSLAGEPTPSFDEAIGDDEGVAVSAGAADETDPPWLHIAHANGYPPQCYRSLAEALADSCRVVGLRTRPMTAGIAAAAALANWHPMADDLVAALDVLAAAEQTGPIVGLGHSLGGVLTLYAAVARPDLFASVVLIDPVFLMPSDVEGAADEADEGDDGPSPRAALVRGAVGRRTTWDSVEDAFDHFRTKPVFARFDDAALRAYVHGSTMGTGRQRGAMSGASDASRTLSIPREWEAQIYRTPPTDVWDVLPRLTVPTLAIRGALSDTLSPAAWQRWQALQPAATFVELPGVGHLLPFEAPGAVADAIRAFDDAIRLH